MKRTIKLLAIIIALILTTKSFSQTDLVGKWELYKIIKLPADTQYVKTDDVRYMTYYFNYNNTFTAWHKKENEEATGKWGFDRKENAIKIKAHTFTKSKTGNGDYNIKLLDPVNKTHFIQVISDKKGKPIEYYIYRKV